MEAISMKALVFLELDPNASNDCDILVALLLHLALLDSMTQSVVLGV